MPSELPGYYFDSSKNKYFRIQPNHIAPRGSQYTRQLVNAEKAAKTVQIQQSATALARRRARVVRSPFLTHPLLSFRHQLGNSSTPPAETIARQYAFSLAPKDACFPTVGGQFAIDPHTKALFALSPSNGRGPEFSITGWNAHVHRYIGSESTPILATEHLSCVAPITPQLVAWTTTTFLRELEGTSIHLSRRFDSPEASPSRNRNERADYGTMRIATHKIVWDIAASPAGESYLLATSEGIDVCDSTVGLGSLSPQGTTRSEQMTVSFKDTNVYMSGSRTGAVLFGDIRGGQAPRLQHSSAVSGLRVLGQPQAHNSNHNHNHILVSGLQGMSIYDLRHLPRPTADNNRNNHHHRNDTNKPHRTPEPKAKATTQPILTFEMTSPTNHRKQNRYGLGFDYDPSLNIVASASTNFIADGNTGGGGGYNHVTLWSCATGKMMIDSPLSNYAFPAPVTCLQMVDFTDDGGPKSILVLPSDRKIQEWTV